VVFKILVPVSKNEFQPGFLTSRRQGRSPRRCLKTAARGVASNPQSLSRLRESSPLAKGDPGLDFAPGGFGFFNSENVSTEIPQRLLK
jgi:hypothetical protein